MTKKDYILLAEALRAARPHASAPVERYNAWLDCVHEVEKALNAERPYQLAFQQRPASFDSAKFFAACGNVTSK